ncbi:hypothetical protein [Vibrio harveyi]|uniref:hypothetical protein n=2 Tax=Vibrio harveyi TaxID=669 RepID=UPI0023809DCC|nr:hypothetical protein [Vibrio harveyi]EKO3846181.1 hypothetical protein [Vibrio harveyi]HDM8058302.1 hypothetical protein [Vibrio harveyi]
MTFIITSVIFLVMALYVAFSTFGDDLSLINRAIRLPISILGGACLAYLFRKKSMSTLNSLVVISLSIAVNAMFAILMFLSPDIRDLVYSITGATKILNYTTTIAAGIRNPGLTYGLSQTSIFQSIGVMIALIALTKFNTTKSQKIILISTIFLNVLSCFFIGRSGLLLSAILLLVFGFSSFKRMIATSVIALLMCGVYVLGVSDSSKESVKIQIERAEEIIDIMSGKETTTTENMAHMYVLPENYFSLAFGGQGMGRSDNYYLDSDVGYARIIFAVGIYGVIIYLSFFIYTIICTKSRSEKELNLILYVIVIISLIYNFKELFFYSRNVWQVYCLIFGLVIFNEMRPSTNNK